MKKTIKMSKKALVETISNAVVKKLITEAQLDNQAIDDENEYDRGYPSNEIVDLYLEKYPDQRGLIQQAYQRLYQQWDEEFDDIRDQRFYNLHNYYVEVFGYKEKDIAINICYDVKDAVRPQRLPRKYYEQLPKDVIEAIEKSADEYLHDTFDPYDWVM